MPGVEAVKDLASKTSNVFWDWGVPLIALGVGYITGDYFGLSGKIEGWDTGGKVKEAMNFIGNPYGLIAAILYFGIGVTLWKMLPGAFGKIAGMFTIGMGLTEILGAL